MDNDSEGSQNINSGQPISSTLAAEWSLLLHSFAEADSDQKEKLLNNIKTIGLDANSLKNIKKSLSDQRRQMNQRMESIKTHIDELHAVIENLELVKSDPEDIQKQIHQLITEGEQISEQVVLIEKELKRIREVEGFI